MIIKVLPEVVASCRGRSNQYRFWLRGSFAYEVVVVVCAYKYLAKNNGLLLGMRKKSGLCLRSQLGTERRERKMQAKHSLPLILFLPELPFAHSHVLYVQYRQQILYSILLLSCRERRIACYSLSFVVSVGGKAREDEIHLRISDLCVSFCAKNRRRKIDIEQKRPT